MAIFFDYILGKLRTKDSSGGGGGTVTSVALALPTNEFTIAGSPVINSGTLTGTWKSQTVNKVFAAPSGGAGTPTFRLLVAADIPGGFIKSDGSVDFTAAESWVSGTNRTTISPTGFQTSDTSTNKGASLNNNGELRLIDDASVPSDSIFRDVRISVASADIQAMGSGGTPYLLIPLRANYTIEVVSGFVVFLGGTGVSYNGITSFYIYTNGANSNQFQIDCPSTIAPYSLRGIPLGSISKGNLLDSAGVYVTTDFTSGAGDAIATFYLMIKETRTS